VVLSSQHPDLRPAQSQSFTTSNGSHTRCEAVFPGNEASISIFQIIFPSFGAKLVHLSVNLPPESKQDARRRVPKRKIELCKGSFLETIELVMEPDGD
jgi:hypothetical protein